jgi:hypothetical protein
MATKEEKRNARRIRLQPPAAGDLSHVPVSVVDLSTSGARIQHDTPLAFQPGKRFLLSFTCDGEKFALQCNVARSRLDIHNSAHRKVYTSGVRFVDLSKETEERLWGIIALLAIDVLAHEAATHDEYEFRIIAN